MQINRVSDSGFPKVFLRSDGEESEAKLDSIFYLRDARRSRDGKYTQTESGKACSSGRIWIGSGGKC